MPYLLRRFAFSDAHVVLLAVPPVRPEHVEIKFSAAKSVPAGLEQNLEKALSQYQAYLKSVGFRADDYVGVRLLNGPDENGMISGLLSEWKSWNSGNCS